MNTEKVFTAFNKDGEEILIFRKDNDIYIDLNSENNEIIPKEEIDLETIMPANKSLNLRKHMLESSIKRKYKKDREKLVETKNILFGIEYTISNIEEIKTESGFYYYGIPLYDYHYEWENTESNLNLYTFSKKIKEEGYIFNVYKNLYDKEEYILFKDNCKHISALSEFNNGMKFAYTDTNERTLNGVLKESIMTKKKVYEYANEVRKTK